MKRGYYIECKTFSKEDKQFLSISYSTFGLSTKDELRTVGHDQPEVVIFESREEASRLIDACPSFFSSRKDPVIKTTVKKLNIFMQFRKCPTRRYSEIMSW